MARAKNLLVFSLILAVASTTCTRKGTTPRHEYKEPLAFDFYKTYEDMPLDEDYMKKVYDTWNDELKDDATIKSNTWLAGDYKVFVYFQGYIYGMLDMRYDEVMFFTTTNPKKCTDKIRSTMTVFEADFSASGISFSRIGTYVYVEKYRPIKNEEHAKSIMTDYLNEYLPCDRYLVGELNGGLQGRSYIRDWADHYVYEKQPHDFGGAIIVNKLTSKLDFMGSSVWMGRGSRYFPPDGCSQ